MNKTDILEQLRKIGETIRLHRIESGLTQKGLAREVGCTQSKISKIESGNNHSVTVAMIMRICEVLHVNLIIEKHTH